MLPECQLAPMLGPVHSVVYDLPPCCINGANKAAAKAKGKTAQTPLSLTLQGGCPKWPHSAEMRAVWPD